MFKSAPDVAKIQPALGLLALALLLAACQAAQEPTPSPTPNLPTYQPTPFPTPHLPTSQPPTSQSTHLPTLQQLHPDDGSRLLGWSADGRGLRFREPDGSRWEYVAATGELRPWVEPTSPPGPSHPSPTPPDLNWIEAQSFFALQQLWLPDGRMFLHVLVPPPDTEPHQDVPFDWEGIETCVDCHTGDLPPDYQAEVPLLQSWNFSLDVPLFEGWLADLDGENLRRVFVSSQFAEFRLAPGRAILLNETPCYGLIPRHGDGLWLIDLDGPSLHMISRNSLRLCEGSEGASFAPDGRYLALTGNAYTLEPEAFVVRSDGSGKRALCRGHAYAWTPDSRYLYYACYDETVDSDALWRYDTQSDAAERLTDPAQLRLRILNLAPSPEGGQIAFRWGTGLMWNDEPLGLWLLDLGKE